MKNLLRILGAFLGFIIFVALYMGLASFLGALGLNAPLGLLIPLNMLVFVLMDLMALKAFKNIHQKNIVSLLTALTFSALLIFHQVNAYNEIENLSSFHFDNPKLESIDLKTIDNPPFWKERFLISSYVLLKSMPLLNRETEELLGYQLNTLKEVELLKKIHILYETDRIKETCKNYLSADDIDFTCLLDIQQDFLKQMDFGVAGLSALNAYTAVGFFKIVEITPKEEKSDNFFRGVLANMKHSQKRFQDRLIILVELKEKETVTYSMGATVESNSFVHLQEKAYALSQLEYSHKKLDYYKKTSKGSEPPELPAKYDGAFIKAAIEKNNRDLEAKKKQLKAQSLLAHFLFLTFLK